MAGFDFHVPKHPTSEALQRGLLRLIQRLARDLGLRFRFRSEGGDLRGELDGPLPLMWALRAYLGEDLPIHAGGASIPEDRRQRLRIARALLRAFDEGLWRITDSIHNEVTPLLQRFGFESVPNSIVFDYGSRSHLAPQLRGLTSTLILDMQGRVPRHTAVEETHTVLELLLRTVLGRRARGLSFAAMVDEAVRLGYLSGEQAADLKRLKDARREAKHRAQQPDEVETRRFLQVSVIVIQKLLAQIRRPATEELRNAQNPASPLRPSARASA